MRNTVKQLKQDNEPTIGELIDQLVTFREDRFRADEIAAAKKKIEDDFELIVLEALSKAGLESARGRRAQATIGFKDLATVEDWSKLYTHILKTKSFELLQKRVGLGACQDRWEQGKQVPGVKHERKRDLKLTALRKQKGGNQEQ